MYSAKVLEHFRQPRNVGELRPPSTAVEVTNPVCGDVLKLSIAVREGRIAEARFMAEGCVPAVACGSCLTELLRGCSPAEAAALSAERIERELGGLPEASRHASALAIAALRQALASLR